MQEVAARPNVELRTLLSGEPVVVLSFPYRGDLVNAVRGIPGRRFDWEAREWLLPRDEISAVYVADLLRRESWLTASEEAAAWLAAAPSHWIGRVTTEKHEGRGRFVARTLAGELPHEFGGPDAEGPLRTTTLPFTAEVAETLIDLPGARLDRGAFECAKRLQVGIEPAPSALVVEHSVAEPRLTLRRLWDGDATRAFCALPAAEARSRSLPIDPFVLEPLEGFLRAHDVEVAASAAPVLRRLRSDHDAAVDAIRRSRARAAEPLDPMPRLTGGELAPFQWAGVRYALEKRRTFLADEQGLGKTIEALAALEADGAFPAVVVCPASLKLNWEREAQRWLAHRSRTVVSGRAGAVPAADITIVNYEIVADHARALASRAPRALVIDESHMCKNPRAKRTQAVRRLGNALPPDALRLALTGTPVMNHPEEIVAQLRILGRLEEFGSGTRLKRDFQGIDSEQRLHWHLRRRCLVRRLKRDVLPQLPDKRRVVIPVALTNADEYRLAERDVIEWLRAQPYDLAELDAKVSAALRAERLAQINALKRIAARGKLAAAIAWIDEFLASDEPLIVFCRHTELHDALRARFPDAGHLLGADTLPQREATVAEFQAGDGPQLLVCSTLVAGQGITLTHASNVAFVELEWTPALHDQAEDRCHRIGQHDAVTAWYLLAAGTIDETIAELLERKRALIGAVTDGRERDDDTVLDGVVRALRGAPVRHLRAVG